MASIEGLTQAIHGLRPYGHAFGGPKVLSCTFVKPYYYLYYRGCKFIILKKLKRHFVPFLILASIEGLTQAIHGLRPYGHAFGGPKVLSCTFVKPYYYLYYRGCKFIILKKLKRHFVPFLIFGFDRGIDSGHPWPSPLRARLRRSKSAILHFCQTLLLFILSRVQIHYS